MKFIKPKYEVLEIPEPTDHMGVLKYLELIGRVCYKSENKITDQSCIEYLERIKNRKHWAILEHYIFTMEIPIDVYCDFVDDYWFSSGEFVDVQTSLNFINISSYGDDINEDPHYIISGSATAFNYLWKCKCFESNLYDDSGILHVCKFLHDHFPEIMYDPWNRNIENDDRIRFLSRSEVQNLPTDIRLIHDFMSVRYITDRGVSHELVRHRPASWAQESTRYVNYGKCGFEFILPNWIPDSDKVILLDDQQLAVNTLLDNLHEIPLTDATKEYVRALYYSAGVYNKLINRFNWIPQQARGVIPTEVKTEIIQTCVLNEWRHFFKMRVPKAAHPQMRELTVPLFKQILSDDKMEKCFCDLSGLIDINEI